LHLRKYGFRNGEIRRKALPLKRFKQHKMHGAGPVGAEDDGLFDIASSRGAGDEIIVANQ